MNLLEHNSYVAKTYVLCMMYSVHTVRTTKVKKMTKWAFSGFYSMARAKWYDGKYRALRKIPISQSGFAFCPRCGAGEEMQEGRGSSMQQMLGGVYCSVDVYARCMDCGLLYTYFQEEVEL